MKNKQTGGTLIGFIVGVIVGLGAALAVAVYVTKVPVPFLNKGVGRGVDMDAAEAQKNKNWDPNSPLYGKNPARPPTPAVVATPSLSDPAPAAAPAKARAWPSRTGRACRWTSADCPPSCRASERMSYDSVRKNDLRRANFRRRCDRRIS